MRAVLILAVVAAMPLISCDQQGANDDEVVDTTLNDGVISSMNSDTANRVDETPVASADEVGPRHSRTQRSSRTEASMDSLDDTDEGASELYQQDLSTGAASARGDIRSLFSADDYPASAQASGAQGTAQAALTIGPSGQVVACDLVRSTGDGALDSATCNILRRRARFTPARDSSGHPISDRVVTPPIVWTLEN